MVDKLGAGVIPGYGTIETGSAQQAGDISGVQNRTAIDETPSYSPEALAEAFRKSLDEGLKLMLESNPVYVTMPPERQKDLRDRIKYLICNDVVLNDLVKTMTNRSPAATSAALVDRVI